MPLVPERQLAAVVGQGGARTASVTRACVCTHHRLWEDTGMALRLGWLRRQHALRWRMPLLAWLCVVAALQVTTPAGALAVAAPIEVLVHEGTSMAVAVSPDGHPLAVDRQGSIWILPAPGAPAPRLTDPFDDARQPTWSPNGAWITFFSYRDGNYHIWAVAPDGSHLHPL